MIDQKAIDYIRSARSKNVSDEVIKQALILNGWNESQVQAALDITTQIASAPVAASQVAAVTGVVRKGSLNSQYSSLLAVVLFFALFILSNHIVKDLVSNSLDTSGKLIINAFIVLPFLLVAFLIHYAFREHEQKNKYLIIAQPYYFVAGWLLLKLLFQVSAYILDKNAAYGVYIVLILVVAVLTGIIFFVQKYLKHK